MYTDMCMAAPTSNSTMSQHTGKTDKTHFA